MGDLSKSLQENEVKVAIIQQNLLEGESSENHVMAERNKIAEYGFKIDRAVQGDHVTLRKPNRVAKVSRNRKAYSCPARQSREKNGIHFREFLV